MVVDAVRAMAMTDDARFRLEGVYRAHAEDVARWVGRLAGPGADVEDLVHDVFLIVRRRLPGFEGEAGLPAWLYQISHNVVRNHRRKARLRRFLGLSESAIDPRPGPEETVQARRRVQRLYQVFDRLPGRDREILILSEVEGLDADALAELLGVQRSTVYVRLHRARARFKSAWERSERS